LLLHRRCADEKETLMHRLLSFGPLLILAIASGCNNGLDHDSAVKVMGSALKGTAAAEAHVMTSNANGQIDITLTNTQGSGSAHLVGTTTKTGNMVSTTFDLTFNHWTDDESKITLDGALHEAATFETPLPLSGSVQLTGTLSASGAVTGAADFDLKGSYSSAGLSVTGQVAGQTINITFSH
jgi:hypothetical protein